ncbi:MAG: tetratricopeptide repeat protein, partial [Desulfobacteraceae bacterium]|nr:tetratricopeptide repeat protein [Desulfobacteraceae bacterium]
DFAEDPELSGMLWKLGINSRNHEKYDWSQQLFQRSEDRSPDSSYAKRSRIWIIRNEIKLGGDPNVLAAVDELSADFADHPKLAGEVYALADDCCLLKRYEDARQLWQRVVDNYPDSNDVIVMKSRIGIIKADINLGDDPNVLADVNELIADYSDYPRLPWAVFVLGEEYYNRALSDANEGLVAEARNNFQKTVVVWERIINELPASSWTPRIYYGSAVVLSQELGQYAKGIEYYQHIVDNWPDYKYAWHAQYFVGMYYERLLRAGGITESEANPLIEQAYTAVVENYPDSKSAPTAARNLGRINFNKKQWGGAAYYFELFLQKSDNNQALRYVVSPLG